MVSKEISVDDYDILGINFVKEFQDGIDSGNAFLASVVSVRDPNIRSIDDLKKKNVPIPEPSLIAGALVKGETDIDYLAWYLYCSYIWMNGTIFLVSKWV